MNSTLYPLDDRHSSRYKEFVEKCRDEFRRTGCLYLPDFLLDETRLAILKEIETIVKNPSEILFQSSEQHTDRLYETSTKNVAEETESSSKTIIAYDQIPSTSLLRQLHSSPSLIAFLVEIIEIFPNLYPSCDELGACSVNIYRQSNQLSWHTDHAQFFVNLLLQQASEANEGIFQYKIPSTSEMISRDDFQAGGLVLFNGREYLHRVTEVRRSESPRINAILAYDSQPDHRLSEYVRQKFYGRINEKWTSRSRLYLSSAAEEDEEE